MNLVTVPRMPALPACLRIDEMESRLSREETRGLGGDIELLLLLRDGQSDQSLGDLDGDRVGRGLIGEQGRGGRGSSELDADAGDLLGFCCCCTKAAGGGRS